MLLVVVLGSAVTAALSAWMAGRTARQAEHERLGQLVSTLTDAAFPLTEAVLKRMSELSGAHFVTLDAAEIIQHTSMPLTETDGEQLARLPVQSAFPGVGNDPSLDLTSGEFRAIRIPVRAATSPRDLSLVILTSQARWNELAWRAAWPPILAGLLAASSAAVLAVMFSRRFVNRIRRLVERAATLAEGKFAAEALPPGDDELRDLAAALNTTGEKLNQYETQIRVGERMQTLGRLGAGMAHQLRNAITGARMALDLHAEELPGDADRESLVVAIRQMTLMESYLKRFLTVGRGEAPARREVDLAALIDEALELVQPICAHHSISVAWPRPPSAMTMQGDAEALRQMLLNLLMNAIEAVQPLPESERKIGVELQSPLASAGHREIELRIRDQGPGPAAQIAGTLFERFATDKPDGTGLGLAVAQEIAQAHGGAIRWHRAEGQTSFVVTLEN